MAFAAVTCTLAALAAASSQEGYHQYMDQYAGSYSSGGYQNYMDQYAHGSSSGGYQKYMDQYASSMPSGGQQSGDFQKYIDLYGGNFTSGGYLKYMNMSAGDRSSHAQQGGDYQQYLDRYASGYSAGGYQKYMDLYAGNYSKYTQLSGGDSAAGYQKYMEEYAGDYLKYADRNATRGNFTAMFGGGAASRGQGAYLEKYAGAYLEKYTGQYAVKNVSDQAEWRQAFVDRYASQYKDGRERAQPKLAGAPQSAGDCHTIEALDAWAQAQRAQVRSYVPKGYRGHAEASLQSAYDSNAARIRREQLAAALPMASAEAAPVGIAATAALPAGKEQPQAKAAKPATGLDQLIDKLQARTQQAKADLVAAEKATEPVEEPPLAAKKLRGSAASTAVVAAAAPSAGAPPGVLLCLGALAGVAGLAAAARRGRRAGGDALDQGLLAPPAPLAA